MTAALPQQAVLPLEAALYRAKMAGTASACGILGCARWQLDPLAESGKVGFTVDIAAPAARPELRFLVADLEHWKRTQQTPPERTVEEVVRFIWGESDLIRSTRLYAGLACGHHHLYALSESGALPQHQDSSQRRGANGGAVWKRESVVAFLKARRL